MNKSTSNGVMPPQSPAEIIKWLLQPPEIFKREESNAFLYTPYSKKAHERVSCYSHLRYDLWVHLEADHRVQSLNMQPPGIPLAVDEEVQVILISAITRANDGSIELHIINRQSATEPRDNKSLSTPPLGRSPFEELQKWGESHGFKSRQWTSYALRENPVWLENVKRLLRYVCTPGKLIPIPVLSKLETALGQVRTATIDHLIKTLEDVDEEWVMMGVASMILDEQCYSDIRRYPLHYSTELSKYHELS